MADIVLSGHGTWKAADGLIAVPDGITLHFYVSDGNNLDDDIGRRVDRMVNFPAPTEISPAGAMVKNYRLGPPDGIMASSANSHANNRNFIALPQRNSAQTEHSFGGLDYDVTLDYILNKMLSFDANYTKPLVVHWSACREHV